MQSNDKIPNHGLFKESQENLNELKKTALHSLSNNDLQFTSDKDLSFFDALSRIQSNRLDDQRCSINDRNSKANDDENYNNEENSSFCNNSMTQNDEFFNLIMKSQRTRLEDQRTSMNSTKQQSNKSNNGILMETINNSNQIKTSNILKQPIKPVNPAVINRKSVTVPPDDDFFSMIQKIQSRRLDEQRSVIRSSNDVLTMKNNSIKPNTEIRKKFHIV